MSRFRLLVAAGDRTPDYAAHLSAWLPEEVMLLDATGAHDPAAIDGLAGWRLPPGFLRPYVNLRCLFALGAGVDAFLKRDDLAPSLRIVKLCDAGMAAQMTEFALWGVLSWQRHAVAYRQDQLAGRWQPRSPRLRAQTRVGVLGLGSLGSQVARDLSGMGYAVTGWRRTPSPLPGLSTLHGADALPEMFAGTDVLINLLPSTPETVGLLDRRRLARLSRGAYVVNASRGDQLDAEALLALLETGHLSGALLDAFSVEPLPADSRLRAHPAITVTPHVAAVTLPEEAARQIADNLQRLLAGEALQGEVNRSAGY